jgi:hypothetical protein
MLLLLLSACDPCAGWTGAEVLDPEGLVDDATLARLQGTVDGFYAASGATDACVGSVTLGTGVTHEAERPWPARGIDLGVPASATETQLREALCLRLDEVRGLSDTLGDDFLATCAEGPRRYDWADTVAAACGTTALTTLDAQVRATVWVDDPGEREHGHLSVTMGALFTVDDLAPPAGGLAFDRAAVVGDRLAVQTIGPWPDRRARLLLLDPANGETITTVDVPGEGSLYDGTEVLVHSAAWTDEPTFTLVDTTGAVRTVGTEAARDALVNAVVGTTLFRGTSSPDGNDALAAWDLDTGATHTTALPPPPAGLRSELRRLVATGDGQLLANILTETEDTECHGRSCSTAITTYDDAYDLYDPATDTWTEVGRDFQLDASGPLPNGVVAGTLSVPAGALYVAWEPAGEGFWVSDDVCPREYGWLGAVAGSTAYALRETDDGRGLILRPEALHLD